jgi:hypothetical protein
MGVGRVAGSDTRQQVTIVATTTTGGKTGESGGHISLDNGTLLS